MGIVHIRNDDISTARSAHRGGGGGSIGTAAPPSPSRTSSSWKPNASSPTNLLPEAGASSDGRGAATPAATRTG